MSELRLTRAQLAAALGANHDTIVQFERLLQMAGVITPTAVEFLAQLINRLPPGVDASSGDDGEPGIPGNPGRDGRDGLTIIIPGQDGNDGAFVPGLNGRDGRDGLSIPMPGQDGEDGISMVVTPSAGNQVFWETPAGTINSTTGSDGNGVFTLNTVPLNDFYGNPTITLIKTDIGTAVVMVKGIHFNISGLTITYTAGNFPISGTTHRASYMRG